MKLRPNERHDEGTSLVELIVVIFLLTIVFAVTTSAFVTGVQGTTGVNARTEQTLDIRQSLDRMSQALTEAVNLPTIPSGAWAAFEEADAYAVRFYANLHNFDYGTQTYSGPVKIEYKLVPDGSGTYNLVENVWQPSPVASPAPGTPRWSYPPIASPTHTRVLSRNLLDTAPRPMLVYLAQADSSTNADGTAKSSLPPSSPSLQLGVGNAGNLAASGKTSQAAAVEIYLSATSQRRPPVAPTTAVTRVHLPNADAFALAILASPVAITPTPAPSYPTPTPKPTTKSPTPTPKPTTKSPTPKPTPKPTTAPPVPSKSPTPKPTTKSPTPKPTTSSPKPTPKPTTPAPPPTTGPPDPS